MISVLIGARSTQQRTREEIRRAIAAAYRSMQIAVERDDRVRFNRACVTRERLRAELARIEE